MRSTISIEKLKQKPMEQMSVEIVERKGRGHPDYVTDGASEAVSKELCKYYLTKFGKVFHHNVDKGLLVGGKANPIFGGGEVIQPMYLVIAGRAVTNIIRNNELTSIPVGRIALQAIRNFLKNNFRFLDVDVHIIINSMIKQGSLDLVNIFQTEDQVLANDTSFGVSYAPLSETEKLVLETETHLNSPNIKKALPEVGEDIKVMALRREKQIKLTIAAPLISSLTPDLEHYINVKNDVKSRVKDLATRITNRSVEVYVNTGDDLEKGIVYLTVTGTSAEQGDDGNTGRGNRIHGLITPCRPMSLEATAGKNPINHVGKIYNILARQIAETVHNEIKGVSEVYIKVLSQIGKPINQPLMTDVQLILNKGVYPSGLVENIEGIIEGELTNISRISDTVMRGNIMLF